MRTAALALVLLAATAAPTPPAVAAEPILTHGTGTVAVPAAGGRTRTLADLAADRKAGVRGVKGTLSVAGAPVPYLAPSLTSASATGADETEWARRNAEARGDLAGARGALAEAETALPVVNVGRRPNAINVILQQQRDAALLQYRTRAKEAQAQVDALPEAARKAGAEPGWVR